MRRSLIAALPLLAACAHTPPMDGAASLAAAETAFAAHSVREDMRAAFLAAFADDGVFVRDTGWEVSNEWLRARPAPPIVLAWRPQYVEVAASGDLGLSTGPWKITSKADPDAAPAYGQFVSIWRRQATGPWKVAVDLGIGHPQPSLWTDALKTVTVAAPAATGTASVLDAEAAFARVMRESGARAAYAQFGAADLRLYRNDAAPQASREAALASPALSRGWSWTVDRSETSTANDLGYARGRYAAAAAPGKVAGYFMRAWRREGGGWRIVMDVINPAAPRG